MNKSAAQVALNGGQGYAQMLGNGLLGHTFKTIEQKGALDPRWQTFEQAINGFDRLTDQGNVFCRRCVGQRQLGQLVEIGLLKLAPPPQ